MFLQSGNGYYTVPLQGLSIQLMSNKVIANPNIQFKLLSLSDITKIDILSSSGSKNSDIHEEIVRKCVIGVLYYPDEVIDYDNSPAGIIDHLGIKILHHSKSLLKDLEETYNSFVNLVNPFDQMQAVISRYTITPLSVVKDYPLDQIFREYAILSTVFPDVIPLTKPENDEGVLPP